MPTHANYVDEIVQAMSIKYNNLVYELKRQGTDIIVLSLGEAFFDIPLYKLDDLPFPDIYHYSHSRGVFELREKLARYYANRYEVPVDPETEIIITAGSKIATHMAFMSILSPGDEVIIPEPAWVSYPEQVRLCHGVPVMVPHDVPLTEIEQYVTPKTKAIVLNSPHNPTGQVLPKETLEHLHALAKRKDLYLVSDEAYNEFLLDENHFTSPGWHDPEKDHTIICNSMSKNYGISGWRIGYIIANSDLMAQILKINQHLITCPATILEHYLVKHFDDIIAITRPQILELIHKRRKVMDYMDSLEMSYLPGEATFYLFVSIEKSRLASEEFCTRLLMDHHISTVPGLGYGQSCDHFIRVSVGTESMERTLHGIQMVNNLINQTAK